MSLRRPHVWIAFLSATVVLLVALVDVRRTSPGPLSSVHAREPDLAGGRDCSECHGGWTSSMTEACLDCHEGIGEQIDVRAGLHGVVGKPKAHQCALCHSEHNGEGFAIVNARSFAQAGVPDPEAFDHGIVGFEMAGRHLEIECTDCHPHATAGVLPKGERRFVGLEADCSGCHEDVHEGRYAIACVECHGQESFTTLEAPSHAKVLPLVGGHAAVDCVTCHAVDGAHSLEILGTARGQPAPRECVDCHDSPHRGEFVEGVAAVLHSTPGDTCVSCHEAEHESFREEGLSVTAEQHTLSGFPLAFPHDTQECADCHGRDAGDFAARYPGRGPEECARCHEDPHGGQFEGDPFSAAGCIACHDRERFEPHAFTAETHAVASLELTGRHVEIACEDCHTVPLGGGPRTFLGTPRRCEGCHPDVHLGAFEAVAATLPPLEPGECSRCHETAAFADVPEERFEHGRWTGFPVRGAHAQAECAICHPRAEHADEFGRRFGRVAEHFGRFEGCVTCHADPHRGGFDAPEHPREVSGRTGCERCHSEVSFRTIPAGFDHRLWTGYPLVDAHAAIACSACHARLREPDDAGRTWKRAHGEECSDCHDDPHAGQFQVNGKTACARCHSSAAPSFLAFDHERGTRFPLGEAHRGVACSACHKPWVAEGDVVAVRYRPVPRECADCHGDEELSLLRKRGKRK